MIAKITEIDGIIDKLESLIKTLREERDEAVQELAAVKKNLDDRELELLQLDEEMQRDKKRFDEERQVVLQERAEAAQKLDKIALRIRELVPLLPQNAASVDTPFGASQTNQNTLNFSED
jgi:chromosome segregation ATPase